MDEPASVVRLVSELPGSARLSLVANVVPLDPEAAMFSAMLSGWTDEQRASFLRPVTISARERVVRRFAEFTNEYPWQWRADDVDAWFAHLGSGSPPTAVSTARGYQNALRFFCDFITDNRYGWNELCADRFGASPVQILHEWNIIGH